jgi:hypothetical protein
MNAASTVYDREAVRFPPPVSTMSITQQALIAAEPALTRFESHTLHSFGLPAPSPVTAEETHPDGRISLPRRPGSSTRCR